MALANASFKIDIAEKRSRPLVLASHPPASAKTAERQNHIAFPIASHFFNNLLDALRP
jgi:hypothetical protein